MAANFKIFRDFEPEGKPALAAASLAATTVTTTTTSSSTTTTTTSSVGLSTQQQQQQQQNEQAAAKQIQFIQQQQPNQLGGSSKREPLGLRQYQHPSQQPSSQQTVHDVSASSSTAGGNSDEDQENDISMASLGSDFVPSVLQDEAEFDDNSFDMEEEEDEALTTNTSATENDDLNYNDDDFDVKSLMVEDEFDYDDSDLQTQLSNAFKEHDESQIFNSTIYIHDIETYITSQERDIDLRALPNYMDYQKDLNSTKRTILINWLVEVSDEHELQPETLFICVGIIDRFLSHMAISTRNLQLLGVAAMFIASKYEEIYPPQLHQYVEVTDDTYSGREICQMEQEILKTLNFRITFPTITLFLTRIFAFNKFPKKVYHMAQYLCYLSLTAEHPFLEYYPSEIALAAVILAANQLDSASKISPDLKRAYDQSNQAQLNRRELPKGTKLCEIDRRAYIVDKDLQFCIEALRTMQERMYTRSTRIDSAIFIRFSNDSYNRVAQIAPPKSEDLLKY